MNMQDFKESLDYLFKAQLTGFVWGHAGVGKSSIVKQYAKEKGYHFFPFYLGTQSDLGDILGLADFVRDENGSAIATTFATPKWLQDTIAYCNNNPDSGAIIFLDEFNRGRRDIMNGMFSLALDKTFHTIKLPENCHIIAAGNPPTDEYFTTDIDETALMARFVHIKLEPTVQEWLKYAKANGIEDSLIRFIENQPDLLEDTRTDFKLPVKTDKRSWSRLSALFPVGTPDHLLKQLASGIVGIERVVAYEKFLKEVDRPLTGQQILAGEQFGLLALWSNPTNIQSSFLNHTRDNVDELLTKLETEKVLLSDEQKSNLMAFLLTIPKDISYVLLKNLSMRYINCSLAEKKSSLWGDFQTTPALQDRLVKLVKEARGEIK